jgi:RNA polymerase sigma-70 factor (ECF subfamily)
MLVMPETEILPVAAARAGDADAWNALFTRFRLPLFTYLAELLRDEQLALDLVQETFINACRHIGSLRSDEKFAAWLFSLARQKCVHHWRKKRPATEPMTDEFMAEADGPFELLLRQEDEEHFLAALAEIPAADRELLILRFLDEFALDEIAEIIGVPEATVKSSLH